MSDFSDSLVSRLFAQHGRALRSYFRRRVRTTVDASDLAQEVYLRLLRVERAEEIEDPRAYLFTIAANLLREHGLREQRRERLASDPPEFLADRVIQPDEAGDNLVRPRLLTALGELPPRWNQALTLRYQYDLGFEEIARHLGVSPTMAKKYVAQALVRCRQRLQPTGSDHEAE